MGEIRGRIKGETFKGQLREPYYKSKIELKSNSSEILPVNCKFIDVQIFLFCAESQN